MLFLCVSNCSSAHTEYQIITYIGDLHYTFANRSFQPRPKVEARKCNLEPLTRHNRVKLSQPRMINVNPYHLATQWNWLATLKAKEVAGTTTCQAPHLASQWTHHPCCPLLLPYLQTLNIPSSVQYVPHLGRYVLMNFLCLQTWMTMAKKNEKPE